MSPRIARLTLLLNAVLACSCRGRPYEWHGSAYPDPQPAPALALVDTAGRPFDLPLTLGSATLIYFGYTFCPDVCPATAADVAWTMEQLGPQADEVAFVFVTVDPGRDTPAVLRRFLDEFDSRFIGLTGLPEQLEAARQAYGVLAVVEPSADPQGYLITHTARLFLVDPAGLLVVNYPFGSPRPELLADLRHVLESTP